MAVLKKTVNAIEEFCFTDKEKAEYLNNHFISGSIIDKCNATLPTFESKCNSTLDLIYTTQSDNKDMVGIFNINKAVGHDRISQKLPKHVRFTILKPL